MQQQNQTRHQKTIVQTTTTVDDDKQKLPLTKRKEDAKQTLYLNRI